MNYAARTKSQTSLLSSSKFWVLTIMLIVLYSAIIFAQNIVYIDPGNTGDPGQNGSIDHPYDSWTDMSLESNTIYLQKCGTTYSTSSQILIDLKNDITFGSYGVGAKPKIQKTGGNAGNFGVKRSHNVIIDGFEIVGAVGYGTTAAVEISGHSSSGTTLMDSNIVVRNCDMHRFYNGIRSIAFYPQPKSVDRITVENCDIHDIFQDGIFIGDVNNITIDGCHLWDINMEWFKRPAVPNAGDGIQLGGTNWTNWEIKNCIIDRRNTAGKFCVIISDNKTDNGLIQSKGRFINNTVYPTKDTADRFPGDNTGGAGFSYYGNGNYRMGSVEIAYNKFVGRGYEKVNGVNNEGQPALYILDADTVFIYYNVFDSTSATSAVQFSEYAYVNNNTVVGNNIGESILHIVGITHSGELKNNIGAANTVNDPVRKGNGTPGIVVSNNINHRSDGSDYNSVLGIVDWETSDFHLIENSPARNTGVNYNDYHYDIDSISVPQENMRDKGAWEYTDGGQTNNNPPVISNQSFNINENSSNGTLVGNVIASDPDAGQTLTYSIISGNSGNAFAINTNTGALSVNNSTMLNFEATPSFALVVRATDNGQGTLYSQATVTINLTNINENPNIGNQTFSIAENSPNGQQVGIVVASDPDAGQTLTYSIISGNSGNAFAINTNTGALSVNNSTTLNFEATPSFALVVRATDNGQGTLYSQATVSVNLTNVNENPNIGNQTFSIDENSPNGQQVGIVVASDPDAGQTLTYSIISGNSGNAFAINTNTGALSVNNSTTLNFEATPSFALVVRATDNGQGTLYSQATVTVNLTNVNENPNIGNQTFSIAENSPNGQQVGIVVASDPDAGQTLTYSIISGNTGNAFAINTNTGALSVNNSTMLNFEATPSFALVVRATDNGQGTLYSQATVSVNLTNVNENPNIGNQTFSIAENSPNGQQVGIVVASDPDAGQTLTYSIISGNTGNTFAINAGTGEIAVNNNTMLNFEATPSFALVVRATDNGQGTLYSQATVTVNLTNVNENPNIGNQTFSIAENSPNGQQVGIVVASDPDAGQSLTFTILDGNIDNAFELNSITGELIVANSSALDSELNPVFNLSVQVSDDGLGNLSSEAAVTVNVTDLINQPPVISDQNFSLPENSPNGQQVGMVVATDPDAGQTLSYSIISGNTSNAFAINENTGALSVNNSAALDFETIILFGLTIRAQDDGQGSLYSQAIMSINLLNVNENPNIGNQTFSIAENSPNGQQVGIVVASDPDAGQSLTFTILDGNIDNAFTLNSFTGELLVSNSSALNATVNPVFSLIAEVIDNGSGNLSSQATVTVNVTDFNQPPQIGDQTFSVPENIPNGEFVGMVIATDPDEGQTLTYSLIDNLRGNALSIDSLTGALTVNNSDILNFELSDSVQMVVRVQDNGPGTLYSEAIISIILLDVNEAPIVEPIAMEITLSAITDLIDEPVLNIGVPVIAFDPDINQTIIYTIAGGNEREIFEIDSVTGQLSIMDTRRLNLTESFDYPLLIRVIDNTPEQLFNDAVSLLTVHFINIGNSLGESNPDGNLSNVDISEELPITSKLYPNPANNFINVGIENARQETICISILTMTGDLIYKEDSETFDGGLLKQIDINHLGKGLYIVNIQCGDKMLIEKFIKL